MQQGLAAKQAVAMKFLTIKINLRGMGVAGLACLGVTRSLGHVARRRFVISDQWRRFDALPERQKRTALLLAQGIAHRQIAEQLVVSRRTVESDCQKVLSALGVANTHQLAQRLIRFQDQGLADFAM